MTRHQAARQHPSDDDATGSLDQVVLRGPADLADALPYLLGFFPDDSLVLVGLHGSTQQLGGRVRVGIPARREDWRAVADQLVEGLTAGSAARGGPPDAALLYVCQEPTGAERPTAVMERLRPLAQQLRVASGAREIPVVEALCVSGGRYWSYCCPGGGCCPAEGAPLPPGRVSPMAAAATVAGVRVQGSLGELGRRLAPLGEPVAGRQTRAFDADAPELARRMLGTAEQVRGVRSETLRLASRLIDRLARGGKPGGGQESDARDDALLTSREVALLVMGLQDRTTRDHAAAWMEGTEAQPALRLWRALARRCVGPYREHAAAPMTLAGWVAWSLGDGAGARVALGAALEADDSYVFARLLHQAVNDGLDPELLRRCVRRQPRQGTEDGGDGQL